jgi:adenosylcobinamide-GDP ribazoletransferase
MGPIMKDRTGFLGAVQFLTRIPVRRRAAADTAAVVVWFPVVGALVGAVVGAIAAGLDHAVPSAVAAAVAVLTGVLITGAFHEDGLADTADAIAGGWTRERRFEILKDPRHGSYGVAALCGSIVVRVVAVASLGPAAAFAGLVAAHALARGAAVAAMGAVPVARPDGLGADYARSVGAGRALAANLVAIAIGAAATGWWIGPLAAAAAVATVPVAVLARRALGGITGDVLGAIEQVAECVVLVVASGLAVHHVVWWA